jgi:cleavage and polyadenylation specificity factor subunit 1
MYQRTFPLPVESEFSRSTTSNPNQANAKPPILGNSNLCPLKEEAMSMLYGELTAPTAVSHALAARIVSADEQNLIVARSSLLQIFRIDTSVREVVRHAKNERSAVGDALAERMLGEDGGEDFMGDDSQVQLLRHEKVGRLILVEEIPLSGVVTGMVNLGRLQNVPTEADCIAISFEDAKVCS